MEQKLYQFCQEKSTSYLFKQHQTKTNYRSRLCSSPSKEHSANSELQDEQYYKDNNDNKFIEYDPHNLFSNNTVSKPVVISVEASKKTLAREFIKDREVYKVNKGVQTNNKRNQILKRDKLTPVKKFDERAGRLANKEDDYNKKDFNRNKECNKLKLPKVEVKKIYSPIKKVANQILSAKKITFGSKRQVCVFKIYTNESACLRNSEIYTDLLKSPNADDDCDTDEEEIERAVDRCKSDIVEGLQLTLEEIKTNKRNNSIGTVKTHRRGPSNEYRL